MSSAISQEHSVLALFGMGRREALGRVVNTIFFAASDLVVLLLAVSIPLILNVERAVAD